MRTANDVYVVAYRELAHKGAEAVGIFWYFFDGRCRCQLFPLDGQQFKSEELRKDHEIGVVIGCHVNEIFDLLFKFRDLGATAHLELHGRYAYRSGQACSDAVFAYCGMRSEERRVWKGWCRTCSSRRSPDHSKQ